MGDENPICTLGDYFKPSHEGYRNTIELPVGNNVVPLRSDTIRLVQNGCSFHRLWSEDPNQHLKDFLKLVNSLDLDGSITTWEDLTTRFLAQFFPPGRTAKLCNDILMFQQHHGESLSEAWTHFKDLLQKYCMENPEQAFVDYAFSRTNEAGYARLSRFEADFKRKQGEMTNKIDTVLKAITDQIAGTLPNDTVKNSKLETGHIFGLADGTKSYPVGIVKDVEVHIGKLKLLNDFYVIDMKKDPETPLLVGRGFLVTANVVIDCRMAKIAIEGLALYDNESWNDPRDFAKPVKTISLPQDVSSTSDRRLVELENQVQRLMEAHLALMQPTQVNKITTSCEICSGPHNTQYCMKDLDQAFVDYSSSRTNGSGSSPRNGSFSTYSSSYQMKLEKALIDFDTHQVKRLSSLRTQLGQHQDDMICKINLLWKWVDGYDDFWLTLTQQAQELFPLSKETYRREFEDFSK
nr:zinc finger, CCHC-type [Tanacetum cinerariifolium]